MNRIDFIKNIKNLTFVAHRLGYEMTDYPENSLEVLETIFQNKEMLDSCNGFEFDIRFTKDHIPVVIHDKYVDDISDKKGLIKSYKLSELKEMNFSFRKSLNSKNIYSFKIITLEEILEFFNSNLNLLKNKIIKIESKDAHYINKQNMKILADIINKFPLLSDNIVHLSFLPQNLSILKKIQLKNNYKTTKSDLLCDYKIIVYLANFMNNLDNISLRVKTKDIAKINIKNSTRVNFKIFTDTLFMNFSNTITEKILKNVINKYSQIGIYVVNNYNEIDEFCKKISKVFFEKNYNKLTFTTDNPLYLRQQLDNLKK